MAAEAYKKGDTIAVVHERKDGKVYGHTQREGDDWIPYSSLFKMDEELFREAVDGAEPYDIGQLSARPAPGGITER